MPMGKPGRLLSLFRKAGSGQAAPADAPALSGLQSDTDISDSGQGLIPADYGSCGQQRRHGGDGGSSAWPAAPAPAAPGDAACAVGAAAAPQQAPHGKLCASVDEMYAQLFGDAPPPLGASAAAQPPVGSWPSSGTSLGSLPPRPGGLRQPQHQQAQQVQQAPQQQPDELGLPVAGLAQLRVRVGRRRSGSDGSGSGFCTDESPSCSSSGGPGGWPLPPIAAPLLGSRSSPRYGLHTNSSSSSSAALSAAAAAAAVAVPGQASAPQQQQQQQQGGRLRWPRRQAGSLCGDQQAGGSRSAAGSPCGSEPPVSRLWHTRSMPASAGGLAVALAASAAAGGGSAHGRSSCCDTPLTHSYSHPHLAGAAAAAQPPPPAAATAAVPGAPACVRSLFGSVPQQHMLLEQQRPLAAAAGGAASSSSGWLARADSGALAALLDASDHPSAATSDDDVIREVNSDNVLSAAWGPQHARLLSFKYCAATSPLNHPGRASPFRGSPLGSPRGPARDYAGSLQELLPLSRAAAALSCPGSPLGHAPLGASSCGSADDAAAAQLRHRQPFGRCSQEQPSHYRPSPLQQARSCGGELQQRRRPDSSDSSDELQAVRRQPVRGSMQQQQQRGAHAGSTAVMPPPQGVGSGGCVSTGKRPPAGIQRTSSCSVRFSLPGEQQHPQQPDAAQAAGSLQQLPGSAQRRPAGAAPAAAVGALLVGWGSDASAATPRDAEQQHCSGLQDASVLGGTPCESCSTSCCSSSSSSSAAAAAAAAAVCGSCGQARYGAGGEAAVPRLVLRLSGSTGSCSSCCSGGGGAAAASGSGLVPSLDLAFGRCRAALGQAYAAAAAAAVAAVAEEGSTQPTSTPPPGCSSGGMAGAGGGRSDTSILAGVGMAGSAAAGAAAGSSVQPAGDATQAAKQQQQQQQQQPAESPGSQGRLRRQNSRLSTCSTSSKGAAGQGSAAAAVPASPSAAGACNSAQQQAASVAAAAPAASAPGYGSACSSAAGSDLVGPAWATSPLARHVSSVTGGGSCADSPLARHASTTCGGSSIASDSVAGGAAMPSLPEVDFIERIGRGSFGEVYRGVWCGSIVAVKVIRVRQQQPPAAARLAAAAAVAAAADASSSSSAMLQLQQQRSSTDLQHAGLATADAGGGNGDDGDDDAAAHEAAVALELAQHEYESWLNANLRHPNIVQLFTSFTVVLEDGSAGPAGLPGPVAGAAAAAGAGPGAGAAAAAGAGAAASGLGAGGGGGGLLAADGGGAGLSWKTHLVMEYCELGTMQDVLQRGLFMDPACPGACQPAWVLATAKEFCVAIAYLHTMDVVHGDLKSSNVLLKAAPVSAWDTRGFVAKVSDFGLSRVMDAISAASGNADAECGSGGRGGSDGYGSADDEACFGGCGWPEQCQAPPRFGALSHAAPELIRGQPLSKASDVYSVGVLLWELVTGQAPYYGMHPGQLLNLKLHTTTQQLLPFPDATPPQLAALCCDCWADDPAARPSIAQVLAALNGLALSLFGEEAAVAMFPDLARTLTTRRREAAAAAAAAAGAGARQG